MRIIPAIDLKNGCVARAIGGDRRRYEPLCAKAFPSPNLLDVVQKLQLHHNLFYIADLDLIEDASDAKTPPACVGELASALPQVDLWLDFGIRDADDYRRMCAARGDALGGAQAQGSLIVGSETLASVDELATIARLGSPDARRHVLSLDFFGRRLRGDANLLERADLWPSTVIALALHAVGADCGPDLRLCEEVRALAGDRRIVYGGGVRSRDDLNALAAIGVDDVLVANAIYEGSTWTRGGE